MGELAKLKKLFAKKEKEYEIAIAKKQELKALRVMKKAESIQKRIDFLEGT